MYAENLHHEIDIDVPPEKVFTFLTDPDNVPLVLPGLIENTNIPPLPIRAGAQFNYKYQMLGVVLEGTVIVEKVERPSAYEFTTFGGGESAWRHRMTPRNGGTLVALDVEYTPPQSWAEKVALEVMRRMNQGEAEKYLANLKTLLEMQD